MNDTSSITYLSSFEVRLNDSTHLKKTQETVYLIRQELGEILNVYGRMVATGAWKDYSLSNGNKRAIFAIFRRAAEEPLYRIIKEPSMANKQGAWRIEGTQGQILKRGKDLKNLLRYFDRQLLKSI